MAIIVSGGRRRGGRHGWKKRRRTARRERKTGVERKNERERPVMAAMMTVSGCVYRLSRSVPARRPSRLNLNRSVFDPLLYSGIARAIELPVLVIRSYPVDPVVTHVLHFPPAQTWIFKRTARFNVTRKWNRLLIYLFISLTSAPSNWKKRQPWCEISGIKQRTMVSRWSDECPHRAIARGVQCYRRIFFLTIESCVSNLTRCGQTTVNDGSFQCNADDRASPLNRSIRHESRISFGTSSGHRLNPHSFIFDEARLNFLSARSALPGWRADSVLILVRRRGIHPR